MSNLRRFQYPMSSPMPNIVTQNFFQWKIFYRGKKTPPKQRCNKIVRDFHNAMHGGWTPAHLLPHFSLFSPLSTDKEGEEKQQREKNT